MGVRLLVGTAKGGFWVTSGDRRGWEVAGPFFKGWKVTAGLRLESGGFVAAVASDIYGPAIFLSPDGGEWEQVADRPAYPGGDDRRLRQVWTLRENRGKVYAGVQDAGVFTSGDGGRSWRPVPGLNDHETRAGWMPGAGGLCCHAFLFDRRDPDRVWCGGRRQRVPLRGAARSGPVPAACWRCAAGGPEYGRWRQLALRLGGPARGACEPRLRPHLFNEAGELRRHVLCFHNGRNTRWLGCAFREENAVSRGDRADGWDTPVAEGDTILFMQAVSGG